MTARPTSWMELGADLAKARVAAGLSVGSVAERTKIGCHQIEAIERGELERMAAPLYAVSFARAFAAAVGHAGFGVRDSVMRGYSDLRA
ncbi:helix-turn-helix domain-containing protein [Sphingomonas sp. RS2018]